MNDYIQRLAQRIENEENPVLQEQYRRRLQMFQENNMPLQAYESIERAMETIAQQKQERKDSR